MLGRGLHPAWAERSSGSAVAAPACPQQGNVTCGKAVAAPAGPQQGNVTCGEAQIAVDVLLQGGPNRS